MNRAEDTHLLRGRDVIRCRIVRFNFLRKQVMPRLTILSRPDCHLCDVVEKMAHRLKADLDLLIDKQNVEVTSQSSALYGDAVPVVLVDGVEACRGKVTEGELRRSIERAGRKARWRRSISRILSRLNGSLRRG